MLPQKTVIMRLISVVVVDKAAATALQVDLRRGVEWRAQIGSNQNSSGIRCSACVTSYNSIVIHDKKHIAGAPSPLKTHDFRVSG